jgi:6-O-methylguanine DNA methyltransferase, DNA binding domain
MSNSAVGSNPVDYLIPCHRVIRSSGALGGYRWELEFKNSYVKGSGMSVRNLWEFLLLATLNSAFFLFMRMAAPSLGFYLARINCQVLDGNLFN